MAIKLYGIPNCDTVKKAINFLKSKEIEYTFVNFKKEPPSPSNIKSWEDDLGEVPVNKKGPTFRKVKESFEAAGKVEQRKILCQNTSAIKRPLLEINGKVKLMGFNEDSFSKALKL